MIEAQALLKKSVVADMKGDVRAAQQPRAKAVNRRAATTTLCTPTPTNVQEVPALAVERTEVELLEALEATSGDLRRKMSFARHEASPHPLRNYRRKYRKVQRLHQQISSRIAQSTVPDEDWSLDTGVVLDKVFTYPSTLEPPYDVFPDEWAHEPGKIKSLVRRMIMREYWKRQRSSKQTRLPGPTASLVNSTPIRPTGWVSCYHATANEEPTIANTNKFAVLQTNESAPQDEGMRQELRRLQDQVAQLGRRLQQREAPEMSSARARGRAERPVPSRRPQHERQTLAPQRRSPPPHTFQRRQATLPPRWNSWSRRQDYTARPHPTQQWRVRGSSYGREPARAPSSPRNGVPAQR